MKEYNLESNISIKDRLIEMWYKYKKYIILSVCIVLLLVILLAIIFNKKDNITRYQDIERIMIINAQNYIKNNNINGNYYVSLNSLNIKIDDKLSCNVLSGVYKENDSYYPYLVCQDYKSKSINDLIEENSKNKEYGELNGDALYFVVNDKYQDAGVKTDYQVNVKGDDIDNGLNVVTYYINDNGKNLGELKRIVIGEDIVGSIPVLTLIGEKTRTIPKGSVYKEQGYNAIDERDGNITDKVKVTGSVDTSTPGTYRLTYSITNSNGKMAKQERTIIVNESDNVDLKITHILNPSEITKKDVTMTVKIEGNGYKSIVLPDNSASKNSEVSYTVYKNDTYDFIVYDINNNSEVYSVEVKNIKKDPPSGTCHVVYENAKSNLKVNANDKEFITSYEVYNNGSFLIKQSSDSYSFNDYPIETKVKMTDVISQSTTISCSIEDKDPKYFVAGGFKKYYQDMGYWLYVPQNANIHEKLPLIVFLHGTGERGTNLDNVAKHGLPKYIKEGTMDSLNIKAFVVAPQTKEYFLVDQAKIMGALNEVIKEYNVDEDRISLFGFSQGGYEGCTLLERFPHFFSAFVAVAGANSGVDIPPIVHIPMRGYAGTKDPTGHYDRVKKLMQFMKEAGGHAEWYPLEGAGHVITDDVFLHTDVLKWAIAQKRTVK